jgi:hypothetical protein
MVEEERYDELHRGREVQKQKSIETAKSQASPYV